MKSKASFLYTEESDSISQALHETLTDKHWIWTKTSTKLHDKLVKKICIVVCNVAKWQAGAWKHEQSCQLCVKNTECFTLCNKENTSPWLFPKLAFKRDVQNSTVIQNYIKCQVLILSTVRALNCNITFMEAGAAVGNRKKIQRNNTVTEMYCKNTLSTRTTLLACVLDTFYNYNIDKLNTVLLFYGDHQVFAAQ